MKKQARSRVAVIGSGLIGIDLLTKILRSRSLDCRLVAGRDSQSRGLEFAAELGCETADRGIDSITEIQQPFDIVFDATNAMSHSEHWARLGPTGTLVIDLTPSGIGHMIVPTVNGTDVQRYGNVNLISCGGQASIPILDALARHYRPSYIEVVTTASSPSVGRATRLNLDEYIETTGEAVRFFTGAHEVKTLVNISAARPPTRFRVAVTLEVPGAAVGIVRSLVENAAEEVRAFAPGFKISTCAVTPGGHVFIAVEVDAIGDHIPCYAGNLDIINAAAVLVAEQYAEGTGRPSGVDYTEGCPTHRAEEVRS